MLSSLLYTDLDTLRVRLVEGESDAYLREQELSKTVKMSKRLSQKLRQLKEHVTTNMVSKSEMDLYKKSLDEKVINFMALLLCRSNLSTPVHEGYIQYHVSSLSLQIRT